VRFPANDPSKVETFRAGIGVRALALDSKGNVWAANNWNLVDAAMADKNPALPTSTWGGGSGFTVIYGVAALPSLAAG
jgi:hypothetical protein